jgi:ribosomal protein RSM22 (predicted rRNA methylase)
MREPCAFSQRLQSPGYLKKTKVRRSGEEDKGYTYLVIARGERPVYTGEKLGRVGGVGRAAENRALAKLTIQHELKEIEGEKPGKPQQFISVPIDGRDHASGSNSAQEEASSEDIGEAAEEIAIREESYQWPRIVAPPMKRSGHVVLDVCHPDGMSLDLEISKEADILA